MCAVPTVTLISAGPIVELTVSPASIAGQLTITAPPRFLVFDFASDADGTLTADLSSPVTDSYGYELGVDGEPVVVLLGFSGSSGGLIPFTPAGDGLMEADIGLQNDFGGGFITPEPNTVFVFDFVGALWL